MALSLSDMVKEDSFRWYRHLTKGYWSGRVEGLQVCVVYPENKKGWFGIGSPGKLGNSKARKAFLEIAGENEGYFYENEISSIASLIKQLAKSRKTGKLRRVQTEHFIESKILRKKINVYINEDILSPVCRDYPFQFPTLWSPSGNTRFLDLLMKIGKIPWAIELKDKTKGQGLAYRHAITQAVLYREFIKRSKKLHTWFEMQGLDAKKCKSGVVFPKMKSNKKQQMVLQHHKQIGDVFGVEILEIDF
jgi:hypothetical protein